MRTLVLSDIHGNWPALEAVAAVPHDAVVCLGDIVGYGQQPGECLRWLRASHASIVQGNHDRALADGVPPRCRLDFEWLAAATLHIARHQLTDEEVAFLRSLPRGLDLVLDGKQVTMFHATPDDPLYSYLGPDRDRWRAALATIDADLVLVGHTHMPFHYQFGDVQIPQSRQSRTTEGRRSPRGLRRHRGRRSQARARQLPRGAHDRRTPRGGSGSGGPGRAVGPSSDRTKPWRRVP